MGRIYVLTDSGQLTPLQEAPFELEEVLQELLAAHPDLLAGDQMNEDAPRRWLLVRREAAVPDDTDGAGRWAIDHVFVDQDGVPTLVEVKRSSDTRLRREVVGQMLDYAANAVVYWPADSIRAQFEAQCTAAGQDADVAVGQFVDAAMDPEQFWERVRTNLQAQRIRMVFVADEIPRELRRIVEFLNQQMDPAEVLAVEIRQYTGEGIKTLVPRVIGMTAEAEQRKARPRRTREWTAEEFDADLGVRVGSVAVAISRRIRAWAAEHDLSVTWGRGGTWGTYYPNLDHAGARYPTFSVSTAGKIEVIFRDLGAPFDDMSMRRQLAARLNAISDASFADQRLETWASMPLLALSDDAALRDFFATWDWYVALVVKAATDPP